MYRKDGRDVSLSPHVTQLWSTVRLTVS